MKLMFSLAVTREREKCVLLPFWPQSEGDTIPPWYSGRNSAKLAGPANINQFPDLTVK